MNRSKHRRGHGQKGVKKYRPGAVKLGAWELTQRAPGVSYGQPVLRHRLTGVNYGAGDMLQLRPDRPIETGAAAFCWLIKTKRAMPSRPQAAMIQRFLQLELFSCQ